MQHPIELLSPARNVDCGIAAINHGADAVYIGPPKFSARAAASNSLNDIEKLINYAHTYSARVYIALNTLFNDHELEEAARLAHSLYNIGADALIIQDMGLLECDLPPIPLHASTQANNRTVEKVCFLEDVGFQQVVLARELDLETIRKIRTAASVPLEFFIHGALCVSYSGQCYFSEVVSGRSANRGECAQFCRHSYTLRDEKGKIIESDRYLLSLKDLDLSSHLRELIDAGISSFKIEGRLKDIGYVKNVTAYYRQLLDQLLGSDSTLNRSSAGICSFPFTPDTNKSFNRGKTDYFLKTKRNRSGSINTPKSLGERLGKVTEVRKKSFLLGSKAIVNNGDGLCYVNTAGKLVGLKANRVEGKEIFPRGSAMPPKGTIVYRNHDVQFIKELAASDQCRKLNVKARVLETDSGLRCELIDDEGFSSSYEFEVEKDVARQAGAMSKIIERQMQKCGGTPFVMKSVEVDVSDVLFIPASAVNELRRSSFTNHLEQRKDSYAIQSSSIEKNSVPWLSDKVTYLDNITNQKARNFYKRHGVKDFSFSPEGLAGEDDIKLMTTKYCIKAQLGICPKESGKANAKPGRLTLTDNTGDYEVEFDCKKCEMIIRKA